MDEYYRAVRQLPSWLAQPLGQLPTSTAAQIHELRFRTGHGIFLTMSGRQVCLKELSECPQSLRECILDQLQLEEIFHTLCGGAVHAHQNELTQGFLTTPSGCRVGVAGRYVDRDGQMDPAAGAVIESADCACSSSDAAGQALRDPAKAFYRDACSR